MQRNWIWMVLLLGAAWGLSSCGASGGESEADLPELPVIKKPPFEDFSFLNQYGEAVDQTQIAGKVHVMDFFFTSCPTVCPRTRANMLTVYESFKEDDRIQLISHSIDTRHDSVPVLRDYAERLEVTGKRWYFVTGDKEEIMGMAADYQVTAMEDKEAPGGFAHSGAMILFDKNRNLRGYYDGTSEDETEELIRDMKRLLDE